jgi:hypothetical protein
MTQGYLARITHQNIQAHGKNDVNQDQIKKVEMILGEIKGQGEKKEQKSRGPEEDHSAFEQLNVLIVIAFHIHSSASTLPE